MIKINLALKKGAAGSGGQEKGTGAFKLPKFDASLFANPQLRKAILSLIVAVFASYMVDGYKTDQLHKVDLEIDQANADLAKVKAELAKTSTYEPMKKQLDADELLIRTKLDTIRKLIADRQVPPKLLLSISKLIPAHIWLSEFTMSESGVKLKGSSLGFEPITDFMNTLRDNEFLTDLKLVDSRKEKDPIAGDVANFELEAKRK